MKKQVYALATCMLLLCSSGVYAQSKMKDGTISSSALPNANAILDLESNRRGLLLPRIALTATNSASPLSAHVQGMAVYNTATAGSGSTAVIPGYYINDGTKWIRLISKGEVSLANTALSSSTTPAGNSIGDMVFNTTAVAGPPAIPAGPVFWDGSAWQPVGADAAVGNEVLNATTNKGLTRAGSGTAASPFTLGLTDGSATNQTMVWDGSKWAPGSAGLTTTALTSSTSPAGTNVGDMVFNTAAIAGPPAIPVGPVYWDGSAWQPVGADAAVGNEVLNATTNKGLTRAGSGTAASPFTLGLTDGTATNQTMVWDGSKWAAGTTPMDSSQVAKMVNKSPVKDSLAVGITKTPVKDSVISVINSALSSGSITGKDLTNSNGILVTGGTGTTLKATSLRLDSTAVAKQMLQSPVKDSIAKLIGSSPVKDSLNVNYWNLKGNANTNSGSNFIGTTDNISLRVRSNNTERMVVDSTGKVGIGLSAPTNTLHVKATSNPLKLEGLQSGSFTTDSVLTADANGVVRRVAMSTAPDQTVGSIEAFAFSAIPSDYLECNGAAVSRTTFATLFAKIGTTYGAGDGTTTFNLPDLRGEFIRGWSNGRSGVDASRTIGSWQKGSYIAHENSSSASYTRDYIAAGGISDIGMEDPSNNGYNGSESIAIHGFNGTLFSYSSLFNVLGGVTRPRNVAMMYAIKAKESVMLPTGQSVTSLITATEPWEKKGTGVGSTSFTDTITHSGPIQIKDGSQGAGKVLTSDANGVASWQNIGQTLIYGTIPSSTSSVVASGVNPVAYTGCSITLTPGTWMLSFNAWVVPVGTNAKTSTSMTGFSSIFFSTSSSVNTPPTYAGSIKSILAARLYAATSGAGADYTCSGSIPITVSTTTTLYMWCFMSADNWTSLGSASASSIMSNNGNGGAFGPYTQLYATKIN
ncbi:phage tail protein [Rurimicrobium arvi]|uniref:Phage tail collar domain-containing protein n=1 Tax=Rurimicrobium arvi TaxID=2049916 RepID=A0ABP8MX09_9BACT